MEKADPFELRKASMADISAIIKLSAELGSRTSRDGVSRNLESLLSSNNHTVFVACLNDGEVVGWVHVFIALHVQSSPCAEIGGIIVSEEFQRLGIGTKLLAAAEAWAIHKQVTKLRVRSRIEREKAKIFYPRIGFSLSKEQNVFDKKLMVI